MISHAVGAAGWLGFRSCALQVAQEAACVGRGLGREDADEDPSGRPIDDHEEVAAALLIGHPLPGRAFPQEMSRQGAAGISRPSRHLFLWKKACRAMDVDVAGLVGLEGAMLRLRCLGLEIAQVADAMPSQPTRLSKAVPPDRYATSRRCANLQPGNRPLRWKSWVSSSFGLWRGRSLRARRKRGLWTDRSHLASASTNPTSSSSLTATECALVG